MKIRKLITVIAMTAVSAVSMLGISAYADDIVIPYTQSSGALTTSDDTNEVRLNICNVWSGNNIEDVSVETPVSEKIVVDFTVSGLDDTYGSNLTAYLIGSVGTNSAWNANENGNKPVDIKGNGKYTVTWTLDEPSETIDSLILQTTIALPEETTLADSGVKLTVNSISTIGDKPLTTTATTEATTTTTTTTTAEKSADAPVASAPAPTGDTGVGTAVAVMALAGVTVLTVKKNKK